MHQGTPLTLVDPKIDPKMDSLRLILGAPCPKKALKGPFMGHIGQFFLDRPLDNGKT